MRGRKPSGVIYEDGIFVAARVGDTCGYSFRVLGREPHAVLTRQATLDLCARLLSDALGAGAMTLRISEARDAD